MSLAQVLDVIKDPGNSRIILTAHYGPEGDSIGSQLAMYFLLRRSGKQVVIYNHDPVPGNLCFLDGVENISSDIPEGIFDLGIVLDSADYDRIGRPKEFFKKMSNVLNIDHHVSNAGFGRINFIDPEASSASEMVYRIYKAMFTDIELSAAEAMYTGMYTDTGSFRYTATRASTLAAASDLVSQGVEPDRISRCVRSSLSCEDIVYVGSVLSQLRSSRCNKFFWCCIEKWKDDSNGDLTDVIFQNLQLIQGAEVFVLLKLIRPGMIRINFRSQGDIDVNKIAARFNGGGHKKAAGATVEGMGIQQVEEQVVAVVKDELDLL